MSTIILSALILAVIGLAAAVILYTASKKFHVEEDPRIDRIEELLPGANCGACGKKGCRDFACALVKGDSGEALVCPSTSADTMKIIAGIAGVAPAEAKPKMAVVRCGGDCSKRAVTADFDGIRSCASLAMACSGTESCPYGCLGEGDCTSACPYDAIHINPETRLPVVDFSKCVGCGKCSEACPRKLIEIIEKPADRNSIWVACASHDKGPAAVKACKASCIGCGKCVRACPEGAVSVDGFLAHIDQSRCSGCGECALQCPRKCIEGLSAPDGIKMIFTPITTAKEA